MLQLITSVIILPGGRMQQARKSRLAVALMLAIFLTSFLFVLGLTMLYFIDRDARAGLTLQRAMKAQSAAFSGILYARNVYMLDTLYGTNSLTISPNCPPITASNFYSVDPQAGLSGFVVWRDNGIPIFNLHALGLVRDASDRILASRELAAPNDPDVLILQNVWDVNL